MSEDSKVTTGESESPPAEQPAPAGTTKFDWDDSQMKSSYANAVNVVSTQEEVMLFFGTNQTWDPSRTGKVTVKLSDRIVLNPLAARRLQAMLDGVLKEYERRFGELNVRQ